jgi:hypothetical protein
VGGRGESLLRLDLRVLLEEELAKLVEGAVTVRNLVLIDRVHFGVAA